MNQDFDYSRFQREAQESLAKIYKESFDDQEFVDTEKVDETYCKIRKILDCPEMEKCHPFPYSLDQENVNEEDTEKVNKIYKLGVDRGIIQEEGKETENIDGIIECDDEDCDSVLCGGPEDAITGQEMTPQPTEPTPMDVPEVQPKPIHTVLYSGIKEGDMKIGEYYSMAGSTEGSKEDCIANLTAKGYTNIMIMAVEQTTPTFNTAIPEPATDDTANVGIDDVYGEDDSEEFLKQETDDNTDYDNSNADVEKDTEPEEEEAKDGEVVDQSSDLGQEEEEKEEKVEENPEEGSEEKEKSDAEEIKDGEETEKEEDDSEEKENSDKKGNDKKEDK